MTAAVNTARQRNGSSHLAVFLVVKGLYYDERRCWRTEELLMANYELLQTYRLDKTVNWQNWT